MADAPPWPNFSTLLRYHIIWYLLRLSALSSVFSDHPHCRCICLYISRLQHLKVWKHYPPPRKKKVRPRLPSSLATLRGNHFEKGGAAPPIPRLTVFAVAVVWFYYVMSCQVKMCFHRAAHMMTERSRALRRYQAWDSQVNARPNTSSIHFVFDFCPIGVDGNASCCMGNHPDQFEDLQLITDGKSVSGIGSEVIIKGLCTFEFDIKDDTDQPHAIRIPSLQCVPSLNKVLLSPHHWSQEACDNHPQRHWTFTTQYDDGIILHWTQPLGKRSYRTYVAVIEALRVCPPHFRWEQVTLHPDHSPVTPEQDDELKVNGKLLFHINYAPPRSHSSSPDRVSANVTMSNLKKPPPVVCQVSSSTPAVATTPILLPSSYPVLTSTSVKLSTLTQGCPEHPSFQTVSTAKSPPAVNTPSSVTLPFVLAGFSYIHKMDLCAEMLWHQSSAAFSSCHQVSLHCHCACAAQAVVHTPSTMAMPCFITNHCNHLDSDPQSFEGGEKVTNNGSRIANKGINLVPPSGPTNPSAMVMSCFMTNHCDHLDSDPQLFEGGKKVVNTDTKIANNGIIGFLLVPPGPTNHAPSLKRLMFASYHWAQEAGDCLVCQEGQCHAFQEGLCQAPAWLSASGNTKPHSLLLPVEFDMQIEGASTASNTTRHDQLWFSEGALETCDGVPMTKYRDIGHENQSSEGALSTASNMVVVEFCNLEDYGSVTVKHDDTSTDRSMGTITPTLPSTFTTVKPDQCTLVDYTYMESTEVGFFGGIKGALTMGLKHHLAVTAFVGHPMEYKKDMHLMQRLNSVIILLHCHYVIDGTFHSETFQQAACKQGGDSSTSRSDAPKGNRVQHCDIHCPTSLKESTNTTRTAAMTLQCDLATSIQCSWSTDYKFLFSPHRTVSEGVVSSRHRPCLTTVSEGVISSKHRLYLTDRMRPCNKRPTSWAYSLQTPVPVAFLVLGAHLKPLTPLQRLYHKIPLSSTDASRAENVTYYVEAEGAGIKTIKPITANVMHIVMIASKLKPMGNDFTYFCTATDTQTKPIPAKAHSVLSMASKGQPKFAWHFDYRSVIGKLNYLAQTSRPDIMYAVHQIARFSADPREPHGEAILYLARYLMKTRLLGIRFQPDPTKGFKCYCDADFSGNWNKSLAARDPATSKSRSARRQGYHG